MLHFPRKNDDLPMAVEGHKVVVGIHHKLEAAEAIVAGLDKPFAAEAMVVADNYCSLVVVAAAAVVVVAEAEVAAYCNCLGVVVLI